MIYFTAGGALYNSFSSQFKCQKISIRKQGIEELINLLKTEDVVIHNAANISSTDIATSVQDNFILTKNLVDSVSVSKKNVYFIFISSMSFLKTETQYKPAYDMFPYAYSKYIAETYCLKQALKVSCVRFSTLFYENPSKDGLSKLIYEAVTKKRIELINSGSDKRDFIPLKIAAQYLFKLTNIAVPRSTYNIVSGKSVSFAEIGSSINKAIPELIVTNKVMPAFPPVLSDFSIEDITGLGEIKFDIRKHVHNYIIQLSL